METSTAQLEVCCASAALGRRRSVSGRSRREGFMVGVVVVVVVVVGCGEVRFGGEMF